MKENGNCISIKIVQERWRKYETSIDKLQLVLNAIALEFRYHTEFHIVELR